MNISNTIMLDPMQVLLIVGALIVLAVSIVVYPTLKYRHKK
jgi:hypothetical protein